MSAVINNDRFRMLLRSQPAEALKLLHPLYNKSLFNIAYRLTRDQDQARDVVRDTFHLIWENRKQLSRHHKKPIAHFLVRVVGNKAVSYFKRRRHLNIDYLQFLKELNSPEQFDESESIEQELISEMRSQIKTFPMREQQYLLNENRPGNVA